MRTQFKINKVGLARILVLGSVLALSGEGLAAEKATGKAEKYEVDPAHSFILFKVQHFGAGYVWGRFRDMTGQFVVDGANSAVEVTVDAGSLYTGVAQRDEHVKSPDFLNAKQFPKFAFKSAKVRVAKGAFVIQGDLTLHGVTKSVSVTMKKTGEGKDPQGKVRAGFEGTLAIKRSDFGISGMVGPLGDKVDVTLAFEGIRQ